MRIPVAIFAVLVALCAVVLVLALVEEPADSRGIDHPEYQTMRQGGSTDRHDSILFWGWLYGTLSIVLFVGLMALGLRRGGKLPAGSGPALLAGLVLFALVFAMLVLSYRAYIAPGAERTLFWSFPRPSAWMLYALWPVPAVFAVLYMRYFDRWVLSDEDLAGFERLVARSRRDRESAEGDDPARADGAGGDL